MDFLYTKNYPVTSNVKGHLCLILTFPLQHLEYRDRLALLGEQIFKLANPGELPSEGEAEDVTGVVESVLETILNKISLESKN